MAHARVPCACLLVEFFLSFFFLFVLGREGEGEEVGDEKNDKCLPWAE